MSTVQPLALAKAPQSEVKGWRKGQELIDALPYIDDYTPEEKAQVDVMIQEEMQRSGLRPSDYLRQLGPIPTPRFSERPLLLTELERIKARQPMPALDTTRYRLDTPSQARRNDASAWKQALENAHSQLEHQLTRILNLELMLKYAPNAWRAQNQHAEVANKMLRAELESTRADIDKLNKARKLQQLSSGNQLHRLHDEWASLVHKNLEIDRACLILEAEVERLQGQLTVRQKAEQEAAAQADTDAAAQEAQAAASVARVAAREQAEAEAERADRGSSWSGAGQDAGEGAGVGVRDSNGTGVVTEDREVAGPPPPPPVDRDGAYGSPIRATQNGLTPGDTSDDGSADTAANQRELQGSEPPQPAGPPPPPAAV